MADSAQSKADHNSNNHSRNNNNNDNMKDVNTFFNNMQSWLLIRSELFIATSRSFYVSLACFDFFFFTFFLVFSFTFSVQILLIKCWPDQKKAKRPLPKNQFPLNQIAAVHNSLLTKKKKKTTKWAACWENHFTYVMLKKNEDNKLKPDNRTSAIDYRRRNVHCPRQQLLFIFIYIRIIAMSMRRYF